MNIAIDSVRSIIEKKLNKMKIGERLLLNDLCPRLLDGLRALDKVKGSYTRVDDGNDVYVVRARKKKSIDEIILNAFESINRSSKKVSASQVLNRIKRPDLGNYYVELQLMGIEGVSYYKSRGVKMFYKYDK